MMIDYGEELSGGVGERRDANLVVDCDDLSEVLVVGLREIRPFIYMANMSLIPNAITGDAARKLLCALIRDFSLPHGKGINDIDWMLPLDDDGYRKVIEGVLRDANLIDTKMKNGYLHESTEERPDGVVSGRFGTLADGTDIYSPSKIKLHDGSIVDLIGCSDDQVIELTVCIDGVDMVLRVSTLSALMHKDEMRIKVLSESIEKGQTPWGKSMNDDQIAEAQVDLDRLVNRNNADKKFLGQWDADGRESLPWGEKAGER